MSAELVSEDEYQTLVNLYINGSSPLDSNDKVIIQKIGEKIVSTAPSLRTRIDMLYESFDSNPNFVADEFSTVGTVLATIKSHYWDE